MSQASSPAPEAFPTAVNSQITDAVTQANVKGLAEAPALAMGSIYQSLAHSTGILFQNAVSTQQQQNMLSQAAANQGVMQIYSVDTMAAAGAAEKVAQTGVADNLQAALGLLGQPQAELAVAPAAGLGRQIEEAVRSTLEHTLLHSSDVAYGARAAADALAAEIDRINRASHDNLIRILKLAGTAACIAAMVRQPDKRDDYQAVLDSIAAL